MQPGHAISSCDEAIGVGLTPITVRVSDLAKQCNPYDGDFLVALSDEWTAGFLYTDLSRMRSRKRDRHQTGIAMTIERIRALYDAQPFQPFIIHLADGNEVFVKSREFIASAPSGRTIVVFMPDDSMKIIDLLLVTQLEVKPAGGRKRRPA